MTHDAGTLRSRLLGEDRPTKRQMVATLESRLEDSEDVEYQLTSPGRLTHEEPDGDTCEKGGGDGGTLLAVTDRKLVFLVDTRSGLETADVPYTDLKDTTASSSILSTSLSVRVWGRGTYSFKTKQGDRAERAAEFATSGGRTCQRVVATLQDARQHISTVETHVTDGRIDTAREARESARSNLETARGRITEAQRWFRAPLEEGFALASDIQSTLSELRDRLSTLEARPLTFAERSRAQAQMADSPELAVVAWDEALGHYRDALETGWGTGVEFEGDARTPVPDRVGGREPRPRAHPTGGHPRSRGRRPHRPRPGSRSLTP